MSKTKLKFDKGGLSIEIDRIELENSLFYSLIATKNTKNFIKNEINRVKYDISFIEAALDAIENLDDVIHIIRTSKDQDIALKKLCKKFAYSKSQGLFILELEVSELEEEIYTKRRKLLNHYLDFLISIQK
jgi:DNA gyrase/topoisomerase IV subunit A